ncbi:MAG: protease inhibitor I42 family protein [Candidatus Methanomethylophilaceae archaeon]|nr:protease inhibitor I42 family protein [Candidatus Methanomethylophilaceae archaeon]MBP5395001.1 protease inhibitor I42 family protein [Candidatus Methanomethylophilaceae archaeon]MBP5685101.1 protease inhibitor I42 family protein [Candidatus Methanomethylophilaceae archaeon]
MAEATKASIKIGETFEWKLESNPSTGYSWQIRNVEEGITVESDFITKSDLCGAPGVQVLKIKSELAGTFTLLADYARPWENCEPLETKELVLDVL